MLPVVKNPSTNAGDIRDLREVSSVPGSGRSPEGRNGNPLQYFCLENPMVRGAWWATVHRVSKSQIRLKWLSTHISTSFTFWDHWLLLFFFFFSPFVFANVTLNFSCWQDTALAAVYFPNSCGSKEMLYTLAIGNNYGNYSIEHWDNDVGGRYSLGDSGKSEEVNIYL